MAFCEPKHDYADVPYNTTIFGKRYWLSFDSTPTIINGITASTSIIIGFTGAIIGILFQLFKDDEGTKIILLFSGFYELVPLFALFAVYQFLIMGYTELTLKTALLAFALSLADIAIVLLGSFYRLARKENKSPTPPPMKQPPTQEAKKGEDEKKKEETKALKTMYKILHYDNWQRGQGIWIANSILITGSLLVVFQSQFESVQKYLVSLMLVIVANFLHLTTDVVTTITYKQMEKIGHEIGLADIKKNYELEIKNKWWYPFRKGASYVLFSFLIASYLFLWFNDLGLSVTIFVAVLSLNLVAVFYYVYFKK